MIVRAIYAVILVALVSTGVFAAEPANPKQMVEQFFKGVGKGETSTAFDKIFQGSPFPKLQPQMMEVLKRQAEATSILGKQLDVNVLKEKTYAGSILELTYVQMLEQAPVIWKFWFYRPASEWYLVQVFFNGSLEYLPDN
jgi:hypothetical protein